MKVEVRELLDVPDDDWPIAWGTVCDTPEALMAAVTRLAALKKQGEMGDATVVERDGDPVAAILSYEDFLGLQKLLWNREMEIDLAAFENWDRSEPTTPIGELMEQYGVSAER